MNDFGEARIDAALLSGGVAVAEIAGGCVCCTAPEALARSEAKNLGQSGAKFEWAGDLFPPAVFNRRVEPCRDTTCQDGMIKETLNAKSAVDPVGDVLWSWSTRKEGESHNQLTFRCAVEPTP